MPVYRVKLDFNHSVLGASETYWTPSLSGQAAVTKVQNLLQKRFALLSPDTYMVGVRVSIDGNQRNSSYIKPPSGYFMDSGLRLQIPTAGAFPMNGLTAYRESQFRQTLNMRVGFGGTRRTQRYLSCIPQAITSTEPGTLVGTLPGPYAGALDAFQGEILSGWQVRGQLIGPGTPPDIPAAVQYRVVGVVQGTQVPPLLGVVVQVPGPGTITWVQGQSIRAINFRPPKGTRLPTLSGTWYVDSVVAVTGGATVYLRGSEKVVPSQVNFTSSTYLRQVQYGYFPIEIYTPYQVGIHKRGRPSGAPRGRRLTRPTLDP